jgi:hypothetical protein
MGWKYVIVIFFVLISIILLVFYWFSPFTELEFIGSSGNSNFSIGNSEEMQFYPNMRFPSNEISYKIYDCPLQRKNDMQEGFKILSEKTILSFNPTENNEEVSVYCDDSVRNDGGLFIAGEGGPVNITQTSKFNVILKGKIILIKDSNCPSPNIAIHELLHVLGFDHSDNKRNIMYPVSDCKQIIGDDIIHLINNLYETKTLADLSIENVSANINGKYLETSFVIRNNGLKKSENANLTISSKNKIIKDIEVSQLDIGVGAEITLKNIWVSDTNIENIQFEIKYPYEEISKLDNQIILELKK